jgi:hypothetical protein
LRHPHFAALLDALEIFCRPVERPLRFDDAAIIRLEAKAVTSRVNAFEASTRAMESSRISSDDGTSRCASEGRERLRAGPLI